MGWWWWFSLWLLHGVTGKINTHEPAFQYVKELTGVKNLLFFFIYWGVHALCKDYGFSNETPELLALATQRSLVFGDFNSIAVQHEMLSVESTGVLIRS